MTYTSTADGFRHAMAQHAAPARRRNLWRRAFARVARAQRHTAEREIADVVHRWNLDLPAGATARLRRAVHPTRSAA